MTTTTNDHTEPAIATDEPEISTTKPAGSTRTTTHGRRRFAVPTVLVALALAFVVAGVVFLVRAGSAGESGATANKALVDKTTTSEVIAQVSTGLNQVLTVTINGGAPQTAAATSAVQRRWLTGDAPGQYATLLKQLQTLVKGQQLSLVTKVSTAGVTSLRGDTAQLLVFLDQKSTRASDGQSSVSAAQVRITAKRTGDRWQISELVPL